MHDIVNKLNYIVPSTFSHVTQILKRREIRDCATHIFNSAIVGQETYEFHIFLQPTNEV